MPDDLLFKGSSNLESAVATTIDCNCKLNNGSILSPKEDALFAKYQERYQDYRIVSL